MNLRDTLQRLSIGTQLFLGLGIILVMVGLLGVVAWQQADSLWAETQGLYEHPLLVRRAVGEIKADILTMHRGMKDAVLAESDAEITLALQEIDRYEADAHRQFEIVYDRYLGPRERHRSGRAGLRRSGRRSATRRSGCCAPARPPKRCGAPSRPARAATTWI